MPSFKAFIYYSTFHTQTVEADNEYEAIEIARKRIPDYDELLTNLEPWEEKCRGAGGTKEELMLCPVHGTKLKHVEVQGRYETMLCLPRSLRARLHLVTIIHYEEGFHLELYDSDLVKQEEADSDE